MHGEKAKRPSMGWKEVRRTKGPLSCGRETEGKAPGSKSINCGRRVEKMQGDIGGARGGKQKKGPLKKERKRSPIDRGGRVSGTLHILWLEVAGTF